MWVLALAVVVSQVKLAGSGTAPEIQTVGVMRKIPPGKTALLQCATTGDPQPTITWEKDGQPISKLGDRAAVNPKDKALRVFRLQAVDEGNYTCLARNPFGEGRITFSLFVVFLPDASIVSPTNLTFMELTNQQIACRSRGKSSFEWLTNNGQRIRASDSLIGPNSSKRRMYAFDREVGEQIYETVLVFQPITFEDYGSFACVAFNDIGHSRVTVTLDVHFSPKVLSLHSLPQQVTWWAGHNTNLTCAVGANELPKITWFRNGHPFKCNNLDEQTAEAEIVSICTIQHRTDGGPGVYRCKAANSLGEILVHEFHVKENYPPPPVTFTPISRRLDEMTLSVKVPFKEDTPPTTYVLASYKLASMDVSFPNNPEYERMGDVNEEGEGVVRLVGLQANSEYNVTVRGRNYVGFGPGISTVINTALPPQVTTPETSLQLARNVINDNTDNEIERIIVLDDKETTDEENYEDDDVDNLLVAEVEVPTAFSVRGADNGGVTTLLVVERYFLSLSFCLFLCSSLLS